VALEPDPERQLKYVDFVDIYANLSDAERDQYQRDYPEETKAMVSFQSRFEQRGIERGIERGIQQGLEQGLERGIQQGLEQGLERGIQRGEAAVLLAQIEAKFGPLSDAVRERIEHADAETLLAWSTRILTEDSVEGVLHPKSANTD
jgi:flagellar biosynthesis/type III secretory pathway protein FliH